MSLHAVMSWCRYVAYMSLCPQVITTNIASFLGRYNVHFMLFVSISSGLYVASVNQALPDNMLSF